MSFLYPLFLAGVAAVVVPIVLHMIRRHTRDRVTFSSLMFLRTTMPRFRSRSRLEHIPLLILRCLIVCLLAFAFARPFLMRPAAVSEIHPGGRVVLLIDTSASMRREGVWARAIDEAKSILANAAPNDRLCVMSFDRTTRPLIGFEQWQEMDPARRVSIAADNISRLSPGWAATDLGHALVAAAEAIEDDEANDGQQGAGTRQIVLVSDLRQGSNLDALSAYEWPERTELVVRAIPCKETTNASLQWITSRDALALSGSNDPPGIRVTNSPDADRDRFQLHWEDGQQMEVYVPAGQSVVVRGPADPNRRVPTKLMLTGDDLDFDNVLYLTPQPQRRIAILYIGSDDPNDAKGMLYYVQRAFGTGSAMTASVICRSGNEAIRAADIQTAQMIVVTDAMSRQNSASLRQYAESGGILLLVVKSVEAPTALAELIGVERLECREADPGQYAMLDRIDFEHPLLKSFSDPRFGDFTRIHFWKHRRINAADCPGARVLAWFDNDDPAWLEVPMGRGSLLVWTSGWHPPDSDLALSSKFVPLLYSALEYGGAFTGHQPQYFVGDPVPIPEQDASAFPNVEIRRPDDTIAHVDATQQAFTQTDLPGIYSILDSPESTTPQSAIRIPQSFAVNLPAGESRTDPLPVEDLERKGVSLKPVSAVVPAASERQVQRSSLGEMESQQKLWRWVFVATLVMLLAEVWLGGWLTRPGPASQEEQI
jgi:hypothetical protein